MPRVASLLAFVVIAAPAHAEPAPEGPPVVPGTPATESVSSPPAVPAVAPSPAPSQPPTAPPAGRVEPPVAAKGTPARGHESPLCPEACRREGEPSEGAGAFFIGAGFFDFAALNHRLRANGYEAVDTRMTMLGGEGHAVTPTGFVVGARGGALLSPDGSGPDGLQRTFGGGFGMVDFGFAFVRREALLLTLTSGLGGYGLSLGIGDQQSASFDDVLANPRRSSTLSRGGLLVGLTLGVDGRVPMGPVEQGRRGFFTLGGRIGGLYGPPIGSWGISEGGDATGGPGPGLVGAYAALAIGFGGGNGGAP